MQHNPALCESNWWRRHPSSRTAAGIKRTAKNCQWRPLRVGVKRKQLLIKWNQLRLRLIHRPGNGVCSPAWQLLQNIILARVLKV